MVCVRFAQCRSCGKPSAKPEDAVDVRGPELLVELTQVTTDRAGELERLAAQAPQLVAVRSQPRRRLR